MRKKTIYGKLMRLLNEIGKYGGPITFREANAIAYPLGGSWLLKKARRRGYLEMHPEPHHPTGGRGTKTFVPSRVRLTDYGKRSLLKHISGV